MIKKRNCAPAGAQLLLIIGRSIDLAGEFTRRNSVAGSELAGEVVNGSEAELFGNLGYRHVAFADHGAAAVQLRVVNVLLRSNLQIVLE